MDAIAAGQLRGSPALAKRLTAAEAELERLQARSVAPKPSRSSCRTSGGGFSPWWTGSTRS